MYSPICTLIKAATSLRLAEASRIGGGLMLPVVTTLLVQAADGRSLGRVTALVTLPVLLGPILGPLIGGLIVQHLSWRWIFWVNVPFCAVGLILA
jgi:MFS family permease